MCLNYRGSDDDQKKIPIHIKHIRVGWLCNHWTDPFILAFRQFRRFPFSLMSIKYNLILVWCETDVSPTNQNVQSKNGQFISQNNNKKKPNSHWSEICARNLLALTRDQVYGKQLDYSCNFLSIDCDAESEFTENHWCAAFDKVCTIHGGRSVTRFFMHLFSLNLASSLTTAMITNRRSFNT